MTVSRIVRYLCGHEESVRLSGACVGVLPERFTLHVPFACGGRACRVCGPRPAAGLPRRRLSLRQARRLAIRVLEEAEAARLRVADAEAARSREDEPAYCH